MVALDAKNGRVRWSRKLPVARRVLAAAGERPRLLRHRGRHRLRAARPRRRLRWRYKADGAVKGGLALDHGRLFFGDYGGRVYAIRQRDGSQIWADLERRQRLRPGGRALLLDAGGRLRARLHRLARRLRLLLRASNGKLAWRHKTGNYVYSSPAVASVPGAGPTVYIGSYDGHFYAFDARSGRVRWAHKVGGKISGSPIVVGDLVFYSNLSRRSTAALGAVTASSCGRRAAAPSTRSSPTASACTSWATRASSCSPSRARRAATSAPATAWPARPGPVPRAPSASPSATRPSSSASATARSRAGWRRGAPPCAATSACAAGTARSASRATAARCAASRGRWCA